MRLALTVSKKSLAGLLMLISLQSAALRASALDTPPPHPEATLVPLPEAPASDVRLSIHPIKTNEPSLDGVLAHVADEVVGELADDVVELPALPLASSDEDNAASLNQGTASACAWAASLREVTRDACLVVGSVLFTLAFALDQPELAQTGAALFSASVLINFFRAGKKRLLHLTCRAPKPLPTALCEWTGTLAGLGAGTGLGLLAAHQALLPATWLTTASFLAASTVAAGQAYHLGLPALLAEKGQHKHYRRYTRFWGPVIIGNAGGLLLAVGASDPRLVFLQLPGACVLSAASLLEGCERLVSDLPRLLKHSQLVLARPAR